MSWNGGMLTNDQINTDEVYSPSDPPLSQRFSSEALENLASVLDSDTTNNYETVPSTVPSGFGYVDQTEMTPEEKLSPERALNCKDIVQEVTCSICLNVIWDARVVRSCGHVFCADCLKTWKHQSRRTFRTRMENNGMSFSVFQRPPFECPTCRCSSFEYDSCFAIDQIVDKIKVKIILL